MGVRGVVVVMVTLFLKLSNFQDLTFHFASLFPFFFTFIAEKFFFFLRCCSHNLVTL